MNKITIKKKIAPIVDGIIQIIPSLRIYFLFASLSYIGFLIMPFPIRICHIEAIIPAIKKIKILSKP